MYSYGTTGKDNMIINHHTLLFNSYCYVCLTLLYILFTDSNRMILLYKYIYWSLCRKVTLADFADVDFCLNTSYNVDVWSYLSGLPPPASLSDHQNMYLLKVSLWLPINGKYESWCHSASHGNCRAFQTAYELLQFRRCLRMIYFNVWVR